jgi:hypothetical protein
VLKFGVKTLVNKNNSSSLILTNLELKFEVCKVTVSIPALDLFPHPRITPFCIFSLTYSCTCLELFPRGQSIQVHDLAKNKWILFIARKWMQSTHGNSGLR